MSGEAVEEREVYLHRDRLHRKNHPDRPSRWERRERKGRRKRREDRGAVVECRKTKTNKKKNGVMRHHVGIAENNKQEWRWREKGGEKMVPNRLWEREEKEGWDYYTPCNMQDKIPPLCIEMCWLHSDTTAAAVTTAHEGKHYFTWLYMHFRFVSLLLLRYKEMVFQLSKQSMSLSQWKVFSNTQHAQLSCTNFN